jgi:hypothetical protein
MNTLIKDDILYVYRNETLLINGLTAKPLFETFNTLICADYAFNIDVAEDKSLYCSVVKDRSGFFNKSASIPLEKVLKIIKVLQDDETTMDRE